MRRNEGAHTQREIKRGIAATLLGRSSTTLTSSVNSVLVRISYFIRSVNCAHCVARAPERKHGRKCLLRNRVSLSFYLARLATDSNVISCVPHGRVRYERRAIASLQMLRVRRFPLAGDKITMHQPEAEPSIRVNEASGHQRVLKLRRVNLTNTHTSAK